MRAEVSARSPVGGRHTTSFRGPSLSLLAVALLERRVLFFEITTLRLDCLEFEKQ